MWDVKTGKRRLVISKTRCQALAASPDGRLVALTGESHESKGYKNFVQLVSVADGKMVKTLASGYTLSLAFSPDGGMLASGGLDHLVRVWDVLSGHQRLELKGHKDPVDSLSISADGNLIASSDRKSVRVWNLATGAELRSSEMNIHGLSFSPVGRVLYLGGTQASGKVDHRLIDGLSGEILQDLKRPWFMPVCGTFSPNGELLAVSGGTSVGVGKMMSGGIEIWNVRTGRLLRELRSVVTMTSFVAFAPQGNVLAVSGGNGARLWDLSTLRPLPLQNPKPTDCNIAEGLAFTPSGEALLAGLRCGRLDLLSLRSSPLAELKPPTSAFVHDFALSPDGNTVVASTPFCMGKSKDCQTGVVAWDLSSGKVKWTAPLSVKFGGRKIAFSPDGKQVAIADQPVQLLDANNGASISKRRIVYRGAANIEAMPSAIAFSKDGRLAVGLNFGQIIEFAGPGDGTGIYLSGRLLGDGDMTPDHVSILRYKPDGSLLVAGRGDGTLLFLSRSTPKEVRAHAGMITSIAFSPDGRLIATAGQDSAVRIWQTSSALLLATLVQVGDEEYIIASPNGSYTASPGVFAGVAFREGDRVYPFEQFDLQLNRPDQVLSCLGTGAPSLIAAYRRAWLGRLRRMGVDEKSIASDFHTPTLTILTKNIGVSTRNRVIEVRVRAVDSLVPLDHLKVMVNDVPLGGVRGIRLGRRKGSVDVPIRIDLSAGVNRVRISAVNTKLAESPSETFEIVSEAPHSSSVTYVLAIGVSKYKNSDYNLQYAAKDAADLAELLESGEGTSRTKVLRLIDGDATLERIVAAKAFLSKAGVDDTVIMFVAGHGLLTDRFDYYFATADIDFERPEQRGLRFQALEDLLDGIPSRRKLLLVDTCHSGEIEEQFVAFGGAQRVADGIVRSRAVRGVRVLSSGLEADGARQVLSEMFADLRRGSGAAIISSTGGADFAFESDKWRNGVFTYSVLEGLWSGAADANRDGKTTVSELRDYVIGKVQRLTGGAQRPTSRRESLEFDFEVSSEDISLRQFRGVSWDNPELCAGNTNPVWCQCMLREARKHFADPISWVDAGHKTNYALQRGGPEPPGVREMSRDIMRVCGQPLAVEK